MNFRETSPMDKMNILTVEDEALVAKLYESILSSEGHRVVIASNGAEAIEKVNEESFDLILLDLKLPDMYGTEVLKLIRTKQKDVNVVIVTGYPSLDSALEAIKAGVYDYLVKPCNPVQLKLVVQRVGEKLRLVKENEHLLRELKKKNERLEENVRDFEGLANSAMAREKELVKKVKGLEGELGGIKEE